jgi:hypothetical protein
MRCRGLHSLANTAYLGGFLFPALPSVAPYCVRGGIRVVSMTPSHPPNTAAHFLFFGVQIGKASLYAIDYKPFQKSLDRL